LFKEQEDALTNAKVIVLCSLQSRIFCKLAATENNGRNTNYN